MRLLIDSCLSESFARHFAAAGYDVAWAGDWEQDPGDDRILARAVEERRVLITLDKDFGTLVVVAGHSHAGILRIRRTRPPQLIEVTERALANHRHDLEEGAIVVATPRNIRVRRE